MITPEASQGKKRLTRRIINSSGRKILFVVEEKMFGGGGAMTKGSRSQWKRSVLLLEHHYQVD